VRCMAGRVSDLRLFRCERSSMPPMTSHDKFGDRLACSGGHLTILQRLRQGGWIARVTDGEGGNRFPSRGNSKDLARFFRIKSGHLVDSQPVCGCFHGEQSRRRAGVVLSIAVGALFFANERFATASASTGALLAQPTLNSTRTLSIFAKPSLSSFVAMRYAQGCSLLLEGAQRAASKMLRRTSCGTGLSAKARGLQRSRISSWTG